MLDVRRVLDGLVWPRDPHDFVGDEMDILDEQVADLNDDECRDAARQLLALCADPDRVTRMLALGALSSVHFGVSTDDLVGLGATWGGPLDEPVIRRNRLTGPTAHDELALRIEESARW